MPKPLPPASANRNGGDDVSDEELRKLDAEIAVEVMGLNRLKKLTVYYDPECGHPTVAGDETFTAFHAHQDWCYLENGQPDDSPSCFYDVVSRYSTDIAAAWQVVEKIIENPLWDFFLAVRPHLATAHFHDGNAVNFEEMDESVPIAICLAALKAVRATKPQEATT